MAAAAEQEDGAAAAAWGDQPYLEAAAVRLGTSEAALKLLISIVSGYPFALIHRQFLFGKDPNLVHLYNTALGLWMAYFNFGTDMLHSCICVFCQFLILRLVGRKIIGVALTFLFQMIYLLAGYYYTATDQYDIKWTMPHCVLTLKLIGLSLDYYDGGKDKSQLSQEQKKYALNSELDLTQVAGFAYFYGAFLVGPQFAMSHYLRMSEGRLTDRVGHRPNSVGPACKRLLSGVLYLLIFMFAKPHFPDDHLVSNEFANNTLVSKCVYIALWGKVTLTKYVACWLVAEGVCILTGLGYNGTDVKGMPQWDACTNIKVILFEKTAYFKGTIASFNIQTNLWAARHIFKRLKLLGNKMLSQVLTLLFLAVWHGNHSGYFMCFFMEFIIVYHENQVSKLVADSPVLSELTSRPALQPIIYILQQAFHWLFMGYPLVPFCLFASDKWIQVYKSVYFIGHVIFFSQILLMQMYRKLLLPKKDDKKL